MHTQEQNAITRFIAKLKAWIQKVFGKSTELNKITRLEREWLKLVKQAGENYAVKEDVTEGENRYSVKETNNGIKYAVLDNDVFQDDNGNPLTARQAYNALIGQKITLEDGDTITFVKKLPGNKDVYNELFKKYPAFSGNINIKAVNEAINKNIVDTIEASTITDDDRNRPQRHIHLGVEDFDNRTVYVTDGTSVYKLSLAIANLTNGGKIAYAKGMLVPANQNVTDKIMETETAWKSQRESVSKYSIPTSAENVKNKFVDTTTGEDVRFSIRKEDPPKKTIKGYKVFVVKNGKLYPPMVANPNGADTPVGVWLNADIGERAPDSKTGRKQVKAGGKGTQGGSGSLAFRPGWHLGETPLATQFDRLPDNTGINDGKMGKISRRLC